MQHKPIHWLAGLVLAAGLVSGCGSSPGGTFTEAPAPLPAAVGSAPAPTAFKILEPNGAPSRDGFTADSVELEAFDAQGQRVSSQTVAFSPEMTFDPLPATATEVEVDYLRQGSVPLFRARTPVQPGQALLNDPQEKAHSVKTSFKVNQQADGGFKLQLTTTETGKEPVVNDDFRIKGVCYAPTSINLVGDFAPNIGDWFFDDIPQLNDPSQIGFFNWKLLWSNLPDLGDGFGPARDDLGKIRAMGANTIRVYSMLSRQQNVADPKKGIPEFPDPRTKQHLTHHEFLAKCWNGGKNPLYVIVGIPMPQDAVYRNLQGSDKQAFYDFVVNETVADLKDEPAVLGFTILNEVNNGEHAYPGHQADRPETGVVNENSDYYWGKLKAYTDAGKATAPDKLFGVSFHDFREIAQYASAFPKNGPTYLQQLKNLDFVGVNTYSTGNYDHQFKFGWGAVTGPQAKPIVFTELGFPATSRTGDDPTTINPKDPQAWARVVPFLNRMVPLAYDQARRSLGICYFEFSDEWWKQVQDYIEVPVDPDNPAAGTKRVPRADRQYGGDKESAFPNGWWDEEGFGLYAVERGKDPRTGQQLPNNASQIVNVNGVDIGPYRGYDRVIPRTPIIEELKRQFQAVK